MKKFISVFLGLLFLMTSLFIFQNCSNNGSVQITSANKLNFYENSMFSYNYKCEFLLKGPNGHEWGVERYSTTDDDCLISKKIVNLSNPNANITFLREVFLGHNPKQNSQIYHYKCEFRLKGQAGYEWDVERFNVTDDECRSSEDIISYNNPDATILSMEQVFLGFDQLADTYYHKCRFHLKGQGGHEWTVERYHITGNDCSSSQQIVMENNPNANILSVQQVVIGYNN